MSRLISLAGICVCWITIASSKAHANIEWELSYPFRLFLAPSNDAKAILSNPSMFDNGWAPRRDLYVKSECINEKQPVLCSEQKLGSDRISKMRSWIKTDLLMSRGNEVLFSLLLNQTVRYRQPGLVNDADLSDRTHGGLVRGPTGGFHDVILKVPGTRPNDRCRWLVDDAPLPQQSCSGVTARFRRGNQSSAVDVEVLDGPTSKRFQLRGNDTFVAEHLVVGLGDSFASGEGNPDIPFVNPSGTHSDWPDTRDPDEPSARKSIAYWLDRTCHRSLMSAQARAVLHLAAEFPRREFIFLSAACSGAEIYEGILGAYRGIEQTALSRANAASNDFRDATSQINQVRRELCSDGQSVLNDNVRALWGGMKAEFDGAGENKVRKVDLKAGPMLACASGFKRKIDAILLSVGGNDVGFSKIVRWATLINSPLRSLVDGQVSPKEAGERIKSDLPRRYSDLDKAIETQLDVTGEKVIIARYPTPFRRYSGKGRRFCGDGDNNGSTGFEMLPIVGATARFDADISKEIEQRVLGPLNKAIPANIKWVPASSHLGFFTRNHGLCQPGCRYGSNDAGAKNIACRINPFLAGNGDRSATLSEFNAYAWTERWFRTPNDAALAINTGMKRAEIAANCVAGAAFKKAACTYALSESSKTAGAIHPNGLGAAVMADAYLVQLRQLLQLRR